MLLSRLKKPKMLIGSVATVLSVAFALLIVGPVFLYAEDLDEYNAPTEGDFSDQTGLINDATFRETTFWGQQANPDVSASEADELTSLTDVQTKANEAAVKAADDLLKKEQADQLVAAFTCTLLNPKACVAGLMDIVLGLAARTLWIAGVLFNITVDYTLNLNTLLTQLPIVDIGWKILRDLANIVFIFIALWAGISITLGIGDDGKKAWGLLAQMVLVALFINFSLFITKAVVDVSNVAALHFYSLIVPAEGAKKYDSGLAEAYLYGLKLGTLYNSKQIGSGEFSSDNSQIGTLNKNSSDKSLSFSNIILIGFFGSLFIIITAWVFFAGAIMFIYRAITLMMLMMLSPLAFVGLILPGASGMAHAWWHKLWSQAFFAPLYLILAYIVVRTINSPAFGKGLLGSAQTGEQIGFAAALTGTGSGTIVVIFNFVMLIGLMVGCLIVAQHLGAKGSEMAMAGFEKIKAGAMGVAGATVRGGIKAPSAVLRGAGSMATGGATKAVGSWMATSRLLNNKMMQKIGVSGWASKKSQEYGEAAEKMRGSRFNQIINKVATKTGDALDVRHLEERAGQSMVGNTFAGKLFRSVTTGALANASIGGKSLQEAYEEDEHSASRRQSIGFINQARVAGTQLGDLQHHETDIQKKRGTAEEGVMKAKKNIANAKKAPPLTPEQQANVAKKEREVEDARKLTSAEEGAAAEIEVSITTAEADLKTAQAQFEATGGTGPESEKLAAEIDVIENEIKENRGKIDTIKNPARVAAAETALAEAKRPTLTAEQKSAQENAIKAAESALSTAETKLSTAEKALKEFTETHGSEVSALEDAISRAWAQITSREAAELTPKNDLLNNPTMVDYQYMPTSHAMAIRDDEHALTEHDKEEFFHNRTHRLSEIGKMVDQRNAQYRQDHLLRQQVLNKQTEELKKIAPELRKSLEHLTGELAEELRNLGKDLKA